MNTFSSNVSLETWLAAIASSACIGVTSLVPWLFNLTFFEQQKSTSQQESNGQDGHDSQMKYLLSFAIGAILGDIFFHLIPESIESQLTELGSSSEVAERNVGVSMIAGIFLFIIVEMCLQKWSGQEAEPEMPEDDHKVNLKKTKKKEKKAEATKFNNNNNNHGDQDLNQYPTPDTLKKMASLLCRPSNETHHITTTKTTIPNGHSESHHQNHQEAFPLLATDISDQMNNNNNNNYLVGSLEDQNLINRKKSKVSAMPPTSKDDDENVCDPSPNNDGIDTTTKSNNKNLTIDPAGYLNLIANGFDNFTHGLAIGASFLVGMKVGILTTFVIFIHEIPHEICDYAILVKSGFSRWEAVKAQSSVSLFGIMGTTMALYVKSVEKLNAKTVWILPFSAGGFLYIALVTLLPDILDKQSNLRNSIGQVASVILGITFMGLVALL